jgi:hypothetical protein
MAKTNIDKSTMDLAGVDSGAKMLVSRLAGPAAAEPAVIAIEQNTNSDV